MSAVCNLLFSQLQNPYPRSATSDTPLDKFPTDLNELIGEYLDPISLDNFRNSADTLYHDLKSLSYRLQKQANRVFATSFVKTAAITMSPLILGSLNMSEYLLRRVLQTEVGHEISAKVLNSIDAVLPKAAQDFAIVTGIAILGFNIPKVADKLTNVAFNVISAAFRKLSISSDDFNEHYMAFFVGMTSAGFIISVAGDSAAPFALAGGAVLAGLVTGELALRAKGLYVPS